MTVSQIVAGISAFITGLVPMSCVHKAPPKTSPPPSTLSQSNAPQSKLTGTNSALSAPKALVQANSAVHDLGEVTLTNHYERCVQLGEGKECILYPKLLDKHDEQITLTFESKSPTGHVHDMIVTQINAKPGDQLQVTFGSYELDFKPNITNIAAEL